MTRRFSLPTARAEVGSKVVLDVRQLPPAMVAQLEQQLTVPNPDRDKAIRTGRGADNVPPLVQLYERIGDQLVLPRGAVLQVKAVATRHRVTLEWTSRVVSHATERKLIDQLPVKLRPYQRIGVQAMLNGVQGFIKAPCGSGKTVMGASALVCTGEPAIVLVHTHDLQDQWTGLLRSWGCTVHRVGDGDTAALSRPLALVPGRPPEIVVATVQTLARAGDAARPMLRSPGAVLLDEAHHAPAGSFRQLLDSSRARYRWGVTATPNRDDGWSVLLPLVLGPELWSINLGELVEQGWLLQPRLMAVNSGASLDPRDYVVQGTANMTRALNRLVEDPSRQQLLLELGVLLAEYDRTTLMLVPRVEQAHDLARRLQEQGVLAMAVTSAVEKGLRRQRLAQLRDRQLQVLVATQLADEGLDVPVLDAVVIASTGKSAGRTVQRIGRVMRLAPGKLEPLVVDVVDPPPFGGQWQARTRAYMTELSLAAPKPVGRADAVQAVRRVLEKQAAP